MPLLSRGTLHIFNHFASQDDAIPLQPAIELAGPFGEISRPESCFVESVVPVGNEFAICRDSDWVSTGRILWSEKATNEINVVTQGSNYSTMQIKLFQHPKAWMQGD